MRALLVLALLSLSAGCIAVPEGAEDSTRAARLDPPADRIQGMTADVSVEDSVARCEGQGIQVPPEAYCAQRVLTAKGRIGVDRLPVELVSTNGAIVLSPSADDAWSFVAVVKTRGLTEDDARKRLDSDWSWSHEGPDGHHLRAAPASGPTLLGVGFVGAQYQVALPAWVVLDLQARTTNGGVSAAFGEAEGVDVSTTNGGVSVQGHAKDVRAVATNGGVHVDVQPTASGGIHAETTNGGVIVRVAEDAARGYDVDAQTTNGRAQILLRDGETGGDRKHATFRTNGYGDRAIQTRVTAEATNGGVVVTG